MKIWDWLGNVNNLIGLATAFFSFWAWVRVSNIWSTNRKNARKQAQKIKIVLRGPNSAREDLQKEVTLPYLLRRDQLTRAELMGILNLYHGRGNGTYESAAFREIFENGHFDAVVRGDLECPDDETLLIPWAIDPTMGSIYASPDEPPAASTVPTSSTTTTPFITTGAGKRNESSLAATSSIPSEGMKPYKSVDFAIPPFFDVVAKNVRGTFIRVSLPSGLDGIELVRRANEEVRSIDLSGGGILLVDGRMSLSVTAVLVHHVVHLFAAIAIYDPKLDTFVVSVVHGGEFKLGQAIKGKDFFPEG